VDVRIVLYPQVTELSRARTRVGRVVRNHRDLVELSLRQRPAEGIARPVVAHDAWRGVFK
jgi:hypothetical protein